MTEPRAGEGHYGTAVFFQKGSQQSREEGSKCSWIGLTCHGREGVRRLFLGPELFLAWSEGRDRGQSLPEQGFRKGESGFGVLTAVGKCSVTRVGFIPQETC